MELKYTKGKWRVKQPEIEPQRLIVDCGWQEEGKNYHRSICRTFGYCDTEQEELANAQLIAAAPRMHKEIKVTVEKLTIYLGEWASVTETYSPEWTHAIKRIIEELEQALAKAEGKEDED